MEEVSEMNRNNFQFSILLVDQVTILAHRGYALLTSLRFPVVPCKKLQLIQQNHFRGQEKEEKKGGRSLSASVWIRFKGAPIYSSQSLRLSLHLTHHYDSSL